MSGRLVHACMDTEEEAICRTRILVPRAHSWVPGPLPAQTSSFSLLDWGNLIRRPRSTRPPWSYILSQNRLAITTYTWCGIHRNSESYFDFSISFNWLWSGCQKRHGSTSIWKIRIQSKTKTVFTDWILQDLFLSPFLFNLLRGALWTVAINKRWRWRLKNWGFWRSRWIKYWRWWSLF